MLQFVFELGQFLDNLFAFGLSFRCRCSSYRFVDIVNGSSLSLKSDLVPFNGAKCVLI